MSRRPDRPVIDAAAQLEADAFSLIPSDISSFGGLTIASTPRLSTTGLPSSVPRASPASRAVYGSGGSQLSTRRRVASPRPTGNLGFSPAVRGGFSDGGGDAAQV